MPRSKPLLLDFSKGIFSDFLSSLSHPSFPFFHFRYWDRVSHKAGLEVSMIVLSFWSSLITSWVPGLEALPAFPIYVYWRLNPGHCILGRQGTKWAPAQVPTKGTSELKHGEKNSWWAQLSLYYQAKQQVSSFMLSLYEHVRRWQNAALPGSVSSASQRG